jgi:hypothetical protein
MKNHNWNRVQSIASYLFCKVDQGYFDDSMTWEPAYNAKIFSIGSHGSVIVNYSLTNNSPWYTWTGPLLEATVPWCKDIRQRLLENQLNFVNFTYTRHFDIIKAHIDGKTDQEKNLGSCNINHVIASEGANSFTFAESNNQQQQYQTVPGNTWLIDTNVVHGVVNQGCREVFQIKFHQKFEQVQDFFSANPDFFHAS